MCLCMWVLLWVYEPHVYAETLAYLSHRWLQLSKTLWEQKASLNHWAVYPFSSRFLSPPLKPGHEVSSFVSTSYHTSSIRVNKSWMETLQTMKESDLSCLWVSTGVAMVTGDWVTQCMNRGCGYEDGDKMKSFSHHLHLQPSTCLSPVHSGMWATAETTEATILKFIAKTNLPAPSLLSRLEGASSVKCSYSIYNWPGTALVLPTLIPYNTHWTRKHEKTVRKVLKDRSK